MLKGIILKSLESICYQRCSMLNMEKSHGEIRWFEEIIGEINDFNVFFEFNYNFNFSFFSYNFHLIIQFILVY
jgi:hypothetical protein